MKSKTSKTGVTPGLGTNTKRSLTDVSWQSDQHLSFTGSPFAPQRAFLFSVWRSVAIFPYGETVSIRGVFLVDEFCYPGNAGYRH
jgi:hypothetical protein